MDRLKRILRESIQRVLNETDYNFHYGSNHDGRPYRSENKYMCDHETGQFGSGTFFSTYNTPWEKRDAIDKYGNDFSTNPNFIQVNDHIYRVDLDLYDNLYRVRTENQGDVLHTMCGDLNGFYRRIEKQYYDNATLYQRIQRNAMALGLECPSYMKLVRMAQEHSDSDAKQSFATLFMEYNGYNGVNVSGIPKFDNSTHGSVIYDLNKVSSDMVRVDRKDISLNPATIGSGHTNSLAYDLFGTTDQTKANSLLGNFYFTFFKELNPDEKMRVVKNIISKGKGFTKSQLEYDFKNEPRIVKYILNAAYKGIIDEYYIFDRDNGIESYIVENGYTKFINYIPRDTTYSEHSFLIKFLEQEDWKYDATKEDKEQYLQSLLSQLTRPLTKSEKSYIEEDYNQD